MDHHTNVNAWRSKGAKLSTHQVLGIYKCKYMPELQNKKFRIAFTRSIATDFNVSVKTVRDIWNQRSWWKLTHAVKHPSLDDTLFEWEMMGRGLPDPFTDDLVAMEHALASSRDDDDE